MDEIEPNAWVSKVAVGLLKIGVLNALIQALDVRQRARDEYRGQLAETGPNLVRIATVAYQEGEIGILQLLDAYRVQRQAQLRMLEIQSAVKEAQIDVERVVGEEFGK